jgi:TfoX/Sxy family transcriptional regulator of competence genes
VAYNEHVAERVRLLLKRRRGIEEKKMFGGIAFLLNGHMCCGVLNNSLVLRLGEECTRAALREPYTRPMDFTGKVMKSMIYLGPKGFRKDNELKSWIERAVSFARSLPKK